MSLVVAATTAAVSLVTATPVLAASSGARPAAPAASRAPIPLPIPLPLPLLDHRSEGTGIPDLDDFTRTVPAPAHRSAHDRLTVTVTGSGSSVTDGTSTLTCHPAGGNHPDARRACAELDKETHWGKDTFAPVPEGSKCTMIYGSAATAHVTGRWAGHPVDAHFRRTNGCEIARWQRLEPLLPHPTS
ncbi:SSI family serine proteinase inhibitor [Streptomyces natalensis]|uniref:Subtilisin inhibitor domain-containing protein n=1 Tax=Streptomyces natalensis ATCC 27448 TaxID=1240678 RepID=A0A0D7CSQ9_9ACTN|nr:SSI family serine proteinase inhibitor [Streptomyces natalensis]KIZ19279.1 hypothetical protein SNA_01750 [Streptomyces natalensis ATCC 27448]